MTLVVVGVLGGDAVGSLFGVISLGVLGLKIWALVDAIRRPAAGFVAAGRQTKPFWVGLTALSAVVSLFGFLPLLGILAVIVTIVYLVDVRPAVREYGSRR